MKFYRENRIDGVFEIEPIEVAAKFWDSPVSGAVFRGAGCSLDLTLRDYLTSPSGLNSIWTDEAAYEELFSLVLDSWPRWEVSNKVETTSCRTDKEALDLAEHLSKQHRASTYNVHRVTGGRRGLICKFIAGAMYV